MPAGQPSMVPVEAAATSRDQPLVRRGVCYGFFAYDIAFAIDLDHSERLLTGVKQRDTLRPHRRVPRSLRYQPAPLRVTQAAEPIAVGQYSTAPTVDAVIYDFGAVSITYAIPLHGSLGDLLALSMELYDNAALLADSRRRVDQLMAALGGALGKPGVSPEIEDYVVYHVEALETPCPGSRLIDEHADAIARILRSEAGALSQEEVNDALASKVSYSPGDIAVIDWNAALLMDPEGDDVRTALEFANVELLEMRFLDGRLDGSLDEAHRVLSRRGWQRTLRGMSKEVRHVAQLQADNAILFEGVINSLKLVGDQYLARIYRAASHRLHLPEWDAGIRRKLQTLESIYGKLNDQHAARRMEVLEWIIIALIAVSIAISFHG